MKTRLTKSPFPNCPRAAVLGLDVASFCRSAKISNVKPKHGGPWAVRKGAFGHVCSWWYYACLELKGPLRTAHMSAFWACTLLIFANMQKLATSSPSTAALGQFGTGLSVMRVLGGTMHVWN